MLIISYISKSKLTIAKQIGIEAHEILKNVEMMNGDEFNFSKYEFSELNLVLGNYELASNDFNDIIQLLKDKNNPNFSILVVRCYLGKISAKLQLSYIDDSKNDLSILIEYVKTLKIELPELLQIHIKKIEEELFRD